MNRLAALPAALAAAVLLGLVGPVAGLTPVGEARAADSDLTIVTDARYDVDPEHRLVRVTVDITARNHRAETRTHKYYFDRAYLAVLPGTTGFRVSGDKGATVRATSRNKRYTMLRIDFGSRLYGGSSRDYRLTFQLRDRGGAASRTTRIGSSFVSIPVWAFASEGARGSTVAVTFPAGFRVTVESGELSKPRPDGRGRQQLSSGPLGKPLDFFAYVVAERDPTYADVPLSVTVLGQDVGLTMRPWDDDRGWATRVGGLFAKVLPELGDEIGLPWPPDAPTVVEEAVSRAAGGYAGLFDPAAGRIEVAYWASPLVVIHEAAHGWFNGALLADRWANEGFASLYAERAARAIGQKGSLPALTDEVAASRIPLNAWGPSGETERAIEAYGYAASLTLARAIAERAGDDALRAVWADAAAGVAAYRATDAPAGASTPATPDGAAGPPDWRVLLDLLEERTGKDFTDLWRTWVVRDEEAALLDARAAARTSYARTLALREGWALPHAIREALSAWHFETAEALMADARTVLAQRSAVEARAERDGVRLTDAMRRAFEAGSLAEASRIARDQLNALVTIEAAEAARPADPDVLMQLGLLGSEPETDLAAARSALETGDLDASLAATERAFRSWDGAWQEGRRRALLAIAVAAGVLVLVSAGLARARGPRKPRRRAPAPAGPPRSPAG